METLGYPSLKQFFAQKRKNLGYSYELLRQVVNEGRIPRSETLLRVLEVMEFSPSQVQKIMEMSYAGYRRGERMKPDHPPAVEGGLFPPEEREPAPGESEESNSPAPAAGERIPQDLIVESAEEVAARLSQALPRIPFRGNEDFWEMIRQLAGLAGRKVRDQAIRQSEQPLLFEKEPEAIYHFLVRKGKIPPYMSKGENLSLGFSPGIDYRDRYRGALLGAVVGEMLGRPAQGLSPRDVAELYGRIDGMLPPRGGGVKSRAGSGAKSLFLSLARVLQKQGMLDPEKIAAELGGPAEKVLPWFETGAGTAESLPAVRVPPLALFRSGDARRLKLEAGILASITHSNPASIAGAIAQAFALARVLHAPPGSLDILGFARGLSPAIAGIEPERASRTRSGKSASTLCRRLGTDLPALLLRRADAAEIRDLLGNGTAVQEGIPFAWACFLRAPDDFETAVLTAVNLGNDAEGTASMTGALCGAYAGAGRIPPGILAGLAEREELEAAADGLLALARRDG